MAGDFPNSIGRYSGQFTTYDVLGRAIQQTNPTEMNNVWAAQGDDSSAGTQVTKLMIGKAVRWKRPTPTARRELRAMAAVVVPAAQS